MWVNPESPWTPEAIEKLRALHSIGISMSKIAAELGENFTRNAVIGKIHRLGLPTLRKPGWQPNEASKVAAPRKPIERRGRPKVVPMVPVEPLPVFEPVPASSNPVAFLEARQGQCRYPLWDDAARRLRMRRRHR